MCMAVGDMTVCGCDQDIHLIGDYDQSNLDEYLNKAPEANNATVQR